MALLVLFFILVQKTQSIKIGLDVGLNGYYVEFVHGEAKDNLVFNNEYCTFEGSSRTIYYSRRTR